MEKKRSKKRKASKKSPKKKKAPRAKSTVVHDEDLPVFVWDLARELQRIYPHGVRPSGQFRRPRTTAIAKRLFTLFRSRALEGEARDQLVAEIVEGAKAEADAAPGIHDEDRAYVKGLEPWINQRGWILEDRPVFADLGTDEGKAAQRTKARAKEESAKAERMKEIERMENLIAEQGASPHLVDRLNRLRASAGLPPKFMQEAPASPEGARGTTRSTVPPRGPSGGAPAGPQEVGALLRQLTGGGS